MPSPPFAFRAPHPAGPLDWEPLMFPEIVRDEVFRLETRRLWLRWPTLADAFDGPTPKAVPVPQAEAGLQVPGSACIAAWRAANESGAGLHLTVEDKRSRTGLGSIHLAVDHDRQGVLDVRLAPTWFRDGLAAEAVQVVVHTAFLLRAASRIAAERPAGDRCGRDTLERCGFRLIQAWDEAIEARDRSPTPDRFAADRRDWAGRQGWTTPRAVPSLSRFAPPPACWSMPA